MKSSSFPLSQKYIDFINSVNVRADFLEGTTASGKTTVGAGIKFMRMVSASDKKLHVIAAKTTGKAEETIIQQDNGILDLHRGATYCGNGDKDYKLPHIKFEGKIIYVLGYGSRDKWEMALGAQFGCVFIDEINTADIEFVRELSTRNDYLCATLNPDDPGLPVYKEFVNRSRPYRKYAVDIPQEITAELTEEPVEGWRYWFFTFLDNLSLTPEDIEKKKAAAPKGTKLYKNKIEGKRGKATGLVFDRRKEHVISAAQAKEHKFTLFTAGLDTAYSKTSPDTIAFTFGGITSGRKFILLDERVYNNAELTVPKTPSDIPGELVSFLELNRSRWGFARDIYIDSADQATILECQKYKSNAGCIYNFYPAFKKTKIIDRIQLQSAWMASGDYLMLDTCREYMRELDLYSWKEDKYEPEDGHDHLINSCQYAWLPFKALIGHIQEGSK